MRVRATSLEITMSYLIMIRIMMMMIAMIMIMVTMITSVMTMMMTASVDPTDGGLKAMMQTFCPL